MTAQQDKATSGLNYAKFLVLIVMVPALLQFWDAQRLAASWRLRCEIPVILLLFVLAVAQVWLAEKRMELKPNLAASLLITIGCLLIFTSQVLGKIRSF